MITYKDLSKNQLEALQAMANFNCDNIDCDDCPLYSDTLDCVSIRASNILALNEKETKQC